jgi:hypothetical protein
MNNRTSIALLSASAIVAAATCAGAQEAFFERISTYPVFWNLPAGTDPSTATVAEIVTATGDGRMLIHSDSPGEAIGFIDISDPTTPTGAGRVEMGGEPTSVVALGAYVFVGVNTSESFVEPGGHVAVVDIATREIVATCDVAGQPDALAVSPDGTYLAVAVENERDEDINDGVIPQLPAGHLAVISLGADGMPSNCNDAVIVGLTGLAAAAPTDPEPEYVDINRDNLAVVTLQENNHIVVVDLASGDIVNHFSAGTVDLDRVDVAEDGVIAPTATLTGVPREPDAVQWIDEARFVTADEGDYGGGSRGFTIFNIDGTVEYAAGSNFEHLGMFIGHYPEGRSDAKGTEPEGAEVGTFGDYTLIFVGSERANFVVVFRDRGPGAEPEILQVLPTNIGPEGLLAIPSRGLLVVASEEDAAEDGIRSTVSLYAMTAATPSYPQIVSTIDDMTGGPIGWGALSALVADDESATTLYAVNDSAYAESRIYAIDVGQSPAVITGYVTLTFEGAVKQYDPEGIALRAGGGFWVASEGNADRPNLLLAVTEDGTVEQEIGLPESVVANQVNNGFEGVASWMEGGSEHVIVAFQREWQDDPDNHVKLGIYDPASGEWSFVAYELAAPSSPNGGWVGLSEITHLGGSRFAIIERDNQPGVYSTYKVITVIDLASAAPVAAGEPLNVVEKTIVVDILSEMRAANGWISDKPEGLAVAGDGRVYLVIDNDGVDDAPGETQFITLGTAAELFP